MRYQTVRWIGFYLMGFSGSLLASTLPAPSTTPSVPVNKNTIDCYYVKQCEKGECQWVRQCGNDAIDEEEQAFFPKTQDSAYQDRIDKEHNVAKNPFAITFFNPTYILPYYYTSNPYDAVYAGNTPDNQPVDSSEFKAQFSFQFPLWPSMFGSKVSLDAAYTQLMFWQFYAKSQYFRETDYMPEIFFSYNFRPNFLIDTGVSHQSNGRGGDLERSWNRAYVDLRLSVSNWLFSVKPWVLIFQQDSSDIHNPNIAYYLGYERTVIAYKFHDQELSLVTANTFESQFKRGSIELDYDFPIYKRLHGYTQLFSGYGQSLIEYNHYTNGAGVGISLSDWL